MTSFIIKSHVDRPIPASWMNDAGDCSFCRIINNTLPAFRVFENDKVIAILDVLPLRRGHTLVIPKIHCQKVSELPAEYAAAAGEVVSHVARALTEVLENTALNVVCNQDYAQAVPHVHYHIVPAPNFNSPSPLVPLQKMKASMKEMHRIEFESRDELDEDDARVLTEKIRARL